MKKALYKGSELAKSDNAILIEGNYYFPPKDVDVDYLTESDTDYTCPWKGDAQYFTLERDGETVKDAAWSYPDIKDTAIKIVGQDFAGYIAFDKSKGIEVIG